MTYNEFSKIRSMEDVRTFFRHLLKERKVAFHPDDDFADYVSIKDHTPTFSEEEVVIYNRLMSESFKVCLINQTEIYEVANDCGSWRYNL